MRKIQLMNELVLKVLKTKWWFILFPFAIVSIALIGVYYIVGSVYLMLDLFKNEIASPLKKATEDESAFVQVVKHIFGFIFVVYFNFVTAALSMVLGILYYLVVIFLFIASLGKIKTTPFAFHKI